jgi:hypothetical protein
VSQNCGHQPGWYFAYQYLKYLKGSLTFRKIWRHGTSGFTSHPKDGVLWIFIALKNPSPRPVLNPRPLDPVASTLTTTPPRRPPTALPPRKESRLLLDRTCSGLQSKRSPGDMTHGGWARGRAASSFLTFSSSRTTYSTWWMTRCVNLTILIRRKPKVSRILFRITIFTCTFYMLLIF